MSTLNLVGNQSQGVWKTCIGLSVLMAIVVIAVMFLLPNETYAASGDDNALAHKFHEAADRMSRELPLWSGLPFVGILLSIALFPLLAPHFWHHHFPKISAFWAILFAVPFLFFYKDLALYEIIHIYLLDYIPFIILLWGLYTVSGGILLRGKLVGTPMINLLILTVGTILASWMGTTGASMLLIRPLLRANRDRKYKVHTIIFFIFTVSNIGGSLTPLGDPPLFLGFLHGVPFFWTFSLLPDMLLATGIILALYFILDKYLYIKKEGLNPREHRKGENFNIRLEGTQNFIYLFGIILLVLMSGTWKPGHTYVYGVHLYYQNLVRDIGILAMGLLSLRTTTKELRRDNEFDWFPIKEVAFLFAGIFMTIIPMLSMLKAGTEGALAFIVEGVTLPHHYFWITGILSSFLDNAPTYLTFFNLALGRLGITELEASLMLRGVIENGKEHIAYLFETDLKAISVGAVFFGAVSYIGNAPNFMVRSIAENNGVKMPSFFGYMLWSVLILFPIFLLITLVFFNPSSHTM